MKVSATQAVRAYLSTLPLQSEVFTSSAIPTIQRAFQMPASTGSAIQQAFKHLYQIGVLKRLGRGYYQLIRRNYYVKGGDVPWPVAAPNTTVLPPAPALWVDMARANAPYAPPVQQQLPLVNPPVPAGKLIPELTLREVTVSQLEDTMLDLITELSYRARKGERA